MGGTDEEYPRAEKVSRRIWRGSVVILAITVAAIGLAVIGIFAQPDARRAQPIWQNGFDIVDGALDGWLIDPPGSASIAEGRLRLRSPLSDSPAQATHPLAVGDFIAQTQASAGGVSTDDGYGLVVGSQDESTAFLISSDGYFGVMRKVDGAWVEAQPWKLWPHVRRGQAVNMLRLECRGDACTFYVNDEITATLNVRRSREVIGLIAWNFSLGLRTVEFESIQIWDQRWTAGRKTE